MLDFAQPYFLAFLPFAVLFGWWHLRRRQPALRYSSLALLPTSARSRASRKRWGEALGFSVAIALLILACANPRLPDLRTRIPVEGISIMLVLDTSNSMGTADFGTPQQNDIPLTRLAAAKHAFRIFVQGGPTETGTTLPGRASDRIGLVTYAKVPRTTSPLTLNHTVLLKVLENQEVQSGVNAGTNIGDAIAEAVIRLTAAGGNQKSVMILLGDGEHNRVGDDVLLPLQAAQLAAKYRIPIYTIDCGGNPEQYEKPEDQKQRRDGRMVLEGVARLTEAQSFTANNVAELEQVYEAIDQLERTPEVSYRYRRFHEYGPWCAGIAFALLMVVGLLERTLWHRVP